MLKNSKYGFIEAVHNSNIRVRLIILSTQVIAEHYIWFQFTQRMYHPWTLSQTS